MAKARSKKGTKTGKSTRGRKKAAPAHELPGGFWRQIVGILLALLAVFLVLTWMGDGGDFLQTVDATLNDWLGMARYFVPLLLVWMAWKIFRSEANRLAPVVWIASILMLMWLSGAFGLSSEGTAELNGGVVGRWLNQFVTELLNKDAAIIIYVILIFVTLAFILQMNPVMMVQKIGDLFRTKEVEAPKKKKTEQKPAKAPKKGEVEVEVADGEDEPPLKPQPKLSMLQKLGIGKKKPEAPEGVKISEMETESGAAETSADKKIENGAKALVEMSDPDWKLPSLDLLEKKQVKADSGDVQANAKMIQSTLADFGINVEMGPAHVGPRVTQYTMRPPQGVSVSKILARDKELKMNLAVESVRIEAPIPGTRLVGVELPNAKPAEVRLRGVLESPEWKKATDPLTFAVGRDISGRAVVANLAKMPHLLIAGTTGSGKSVMTNTLLSSLLYRNAPSDLKMIIVDPKQVEMVSYNEIAHLLTPVITSSDKAVSALRWAVNEMERRYSLMAEERVKTIVDYNEKMARKAMVEASKEKGAAGAGVVAGASGAAGGDKSSAKMANSGRTIAVDDADDLAQNDKSKGKNATGIQKMPYIVILVDEMADIMMEAGKELEQPIVKIAQKGRAAGMHLVLATQKPIVQVITGLIKSNVPGRIAFAVQSQIDSRVILDEMGAEKLLGKGDMLMSTIETMGKPQRIQGALTSDEDVANLTAYIRLQRAPEYNNEVVAQQVQLKGMGPADGGAIGDLGRRYDPNDPMVRRAMEITLKQGKFSTSSLQTYLGKGHGFVSGLALWLEEIGVIGPKDGNKPRDVMITTMEEFDQKAGGAGE